MMNHNGNHIVILSTLITSHNGGWVRSNGCLVSCSTSNQKLQYDEHQKRWYSDSPDELLNPLIIGRHADTQQSCMTASRISIGLLPNGWSHQRPPPYCRHCKLVQDAPNTKLFRRNRMTRQNFRCARLFMKQLPVATQKQDIRIDCWVIP